MQSVSNQEASIWLKHQTLSLQLKLLDDVRHPEIHKALKKTLLQGGKRVRPILTCLMADLFGIDRDTILPYARAIEILHSATLSHDDVIDDSPERRHQPSLHMITSNKHAILAGDYLLAEALLTVSKVGPPDLVTELSKVMMDLSLGEWKQLDIANRGYASIDEIDEVAYLKTGSLLSWCCVAPAFLAKLPFEGIDNCRSLGRALGQLFQLIDDVLDFSGGDTGKPKGNDTQQGVLNSVVCRLGLISPEEQKNLLNFQGLSAAGQRMLDLAIIEVREAAFDAAAKAHKAVDSLSEIRINAEGSDGARTALHQLIELLLHRAR